MWFVHSLGLALVRTSPIERWCTRLTTSSIDPIIDSICTRSSSLYTCTVYIHEESLALALVRCVHSTLFQCFCNRFGSHSLVKISSKPSRGWLRMILLFFSEPCSIRGKVQVKLSNLMRRNWNELLSWMQQEPPWLLATSLEMSKIWVWCLSTIPSLIVDILYFLSSITPWELHTHGCSAITHAVPAWIYVSNLSYRHIRWC